MSSYVLPPDIAQLVQDQLASGHYATPDDVLRDALQAPPRSGTTVPGR